MSLPELRRRLAGPAQSLARVLLAAGLAVGVGLVAREAERHVRATQAFTVDQLEVTGLDGLTEGEVLAAAGIARGQNVLARSPEEVRAALLSHPRIAEAQVERRLPGTWRLRIHEHVPAAILALTTPTPPASAEVAGSASSPDSTEPPSGGAGEASRAPPAALVLLSDRGVPFDALGDDELLDLPVVTGLSLARFRADPGFRETRLLEVAALLRDWAASDLAEAVALEEIHLARDGGIDLVVGDDGLRLALGDAPHGPTLARAERVLDALRRRGTDPGYLLLDDPRHPDRAIVGMRR